MWSYDGSGGWYDHVRPPAGRGLRVPALLVSPYARRSQVNHRVLDYTSALRFIEQNWGVDPLTQRDTEATSIASAFDFSAPPRRAEVIPAGGAKEHPPLVRTGIIYWFYGTATVLALLLTGFAGYRSRRPTRPAAPGKQTELSEDGELTEVTVP
jgi:phospholipase C